MCKDLTTIARDLFSNGRNPLKKWNWEDDIISVGDLKEEFKNFYKKIGSNDSVTEEDLKMIFENFVEGDGFKFSEIRKVLFWKVLGLPYGNRDIIELNVNEAREIVDDICEVLNPSKDEFFELKEKLDDMHDDEKISIKDFISLIKSDEYQIELKKIFMIKD